MIKIEKTEVYGWEAAIRGMRNPMNSWDKSDSTYQDVFEDPEALKLYYMKSYTAGENDLDLMEKLAQAGSDHGKFLRMITVTCDITAPLYWWKEFDTYKVGTVANSCSTMHKIHAKEFTLDDFSHEHLERIIEDEGGDIVPVWDFYRPLEYTVEMLNKARELYLRAKTKPMKDNTERAGLVKRYWWQMIQLLPSSYNQKRTVQLNYEVLRNINRPGRRKDHKLDEWREFCKWVDSLPYFTDIVRI